MDDAHIEQTLAFDGRLGRLEAIVEALAGDVRSLTDHIRSRQATPWGILAAWASVMLMIGGLALSPMYLSIDEQRVNQLIVEGEANDTREYVIDRTARMDTDIVWLKNQVLNNAAQITGNSGVPLYSPLRSGQSTPYQGSGMQGWSPPSP